jgi:hypothetical protein
MPGLGSIEASRSLIGLLPFAIILCSVAIIAAVGIFVRLNLDQLGEIMASMLFILMGVGAVTAIVTTICITINPTERFDGSGAGSDVSGFKALWMDLSGVEHKVCSYISRADDFIKNEVGPAGLSNPDMIRVAQEKARNKVGGPLVDCGASWDRVIPTFHDTDDRITKLETTLKRFTGAEFQKVYNMSVPCPRIIDVTDTDSIVLPSHDESFFTNKDKEQVVAGFQKRLKAVKDTILVQELSMLIPIQQKVDDLRSGKVSDCDQALAVNTVTSGSGSGSQAS